MAVVVKYVVTREGEEKMAFTSKKEADAYDKMLDLADTLNGWLAQGPVELEARQQDTLAMWLAGQRETLSAILKTGQLPDAALTATPGAEPAPVVPHRPATKKPRAA
ncbi:damage-inducible protein YebG [Shimwellia pseudoproteus]|uniref:YebG family protein n=1 Tax=Shimwellia pseudoproteus TaxID=570012 RepID=UPI0018ED13D1|nr:YebG family protein [Shimwellia pseudoproteus]MBJ3813992.1 damage-inducible protein YebG [Shimwellia pseudoproteus]